MSDLQVRVFDGPYDPAVHGEFDEGFEKEYNTFKYQWDAFQLHAFQAICRGDDVLVSAPTSSGKSHVGWYGLKRHLFGDQNPDPKRKKVIYTAPIKTLSNEKFEEMTEYLSEYGIEPGLLTGDHRVNVESDFLIMTAEILANALFRLKDNMNAEQETEQNQYELDSEFVNSISCVIMDEIHFISDRSRGHVWENTIILLDSAVQLIGLSATIDQPESFAQWISTTRGRSISLIKKYDRPVPLEYRIYDGYEGRVIMDSDSNYDGNAWQESVRNLRELKSECDAKKTDMRLRMLRSFVNYAETNNLMQVCVIVFSKRNCERFAEKISKSLLSGREAAQAVKALELKLGTHLKTQENMPRFQQIKRLLQKGVSFHHAGMPIILKEAVEYLYKEGHIKLLFATETVAIGVNMPVRTIVFVSLEKASGMSEDGKGSSIRYINAAEFKQICGRAGRRGKDPMGTVVFLPIYSIPDETVVRRDLLSGPMPKIQSRMDLTYHSYLKTEVSSVIDRDTYFDKSLLRVKNEGLASSAKIECENMQVTLKEIESKIKHIEDSAPAQELDRVRAFLREDSKYNANDFGGLQIKMTSKQRKKFEALKRDAQKHPEYLKALRDLNDMSNRVVDKRDEIQRYQRYRDGRYSQIREFLLHTGYITDGGITDYGLMVAHINECNPFILAEIFTGNIIESLSPVEIIGVCSILTDPISSRDKIDITVKSLDASPGVKDAIYYIRDRIRVYEDVEADLRLTNMIEDADYWRTSLDYVEISQTWAETNVETSGHARILTMLAEMDEYEGSFIKNMLKIDTIVSNLIGLCNLTSNLTNIPKLEKVHDLIIKGMVNTDSLHVRV